MRFDDVCKIADDYEKHIGIKEDEIAWNLWVIDSEIENLKLKLEDAYKQIEKMYAK